MWFVPPRMEDAYTHGFQPAIEAARYVPYRWTRTISWAR